MSWDEVAMPKGKFLKIQDGEALQLFFGKGSPTREVKHWSGGQPTDCTGEGCALCAAGDKPEVTWAFDVIVVGEESEGDRILAFPPWHAVTIRNLRDKDPRKFEESIVMVSRSGTGRSTKYIANLVGKYDPQLPF